ncbi:MAG: uracil phosphoribosyltransferase [Candidatus Gottesmanbacteria bacterium]
MKQTMSHVTLVQHPLIDHSLTVLRDKHCSTADFRRHAGIVSKILILEATKHLHVVDKAIDTPLASMKGKRLKNDVVVVPVLRSGLAMLIELQDFLPSTRVGFIGLSRDEKTAQAHQYYQKLPKIFSSHTVFLIDPMLATGGSLIESMNMLRAKGAKNITIVCIVSAPEGIKRIEQVYPDVHIYTAAIDNKLNAQKFIVPGLGDFGDRYFGTV